MLNVVQSEWVPPAFGLPALVACSLWFAEGEVLHADFHTVDVEPSNSLLPAFDVESLVLSVHVTPVAAQSTTISSPLLRKNLTSCISTLTAL
jgi:hypothetical protein